MFPTDKIWTPVQCLLFDRMLAFGIDHELTIEAVEQIHKETPFVDVFTREKPSSCIRSLFVWDRTTKGLMYWQDKAIGIRHLDQMWNLVSDEEDRGRYYWGKWDTKEGYISIQPFV